MRKILRYLQWIPFAIALGALVIYIVYTINVKLHPAIIITDDLINTLKTYLIIALVSLFIGLLIILIKKIYKLMKPNIYAQDEKVVTTTKKEKVISEEKHEDIIKVTEEKPIVEEKIVKEEYVHQIKEVVCPECNAHISKNAAICPHCGILFDDEVLRILDKYNDRKYKISKKTPFMIIVNICLTILFIILIFIICNILYNRYNQNIKNIASIIERQ